MIDSNLLKAVCDQDSLVALLSAREERGGLGWPVDSDEPFQLEPEIARDVKINGSITISRLIPASLDARHLVILAEFEQPFLRRDLRELLRSIRKQIRELGRFEDHTGYGDTLFIVAGPDYSEVRFVLFEERERRVPRIRSFGWAQNYIGRTVLTHNLGCLLWSMRAGWERAWDVEGLTEDFYTEFTKVFDFVVEETSHPGGIEKQRAYVQQLMNRLLFLSFVERMGWLRTPAGDTDYLRAQWLRYNAPDRYEELADRSLIPATFNELLNQLFLALDSQEGVDPDNRLYHLLGTVPYLNGGLFSAEAGLDVPGVKVSDRAFQLVLGDRHPGFDGGLFRRFNFTVTESTPLDQEVAVDPEMLGKIFERIIIAEERHGTGTYYTPRPIVEFMVNEALKGYLIERGLAITKAALLVDDDTVEKDDLAFKPSEMQSTLDWLFEVRAVDPACGSGAYLLLLLQRLFELVDRLEVVQSKRRNADQKHLYNLKLRLLERCIYGVDKNDMAVRIARLRLWLSLVVENKGVKPDPLPNFDFLIMCGDSLACPVRPGQHALGYPHDAIAEYTRMKRRFFHPSGNMAARPMREDMTKKRAEIADYFADEMANSPLRQLAKRPFDWEIDFAEVFDPEESEETLGGHLNLGMAVGKRGQGELPGMTSRLPGFDIVLGNPPYVNSGELLRNMGKDYKKALVAAYPRTGSGTADLLVFFIERALDLLRPGGYLAFITSNKWLKTTYGKRLRSYLARVANVQRLIDFGDLPVFQKVIAYPLISIIRVNNISSCKLIYVGGDNFKCYITKVSSLDSPYPDIPSIVNSQQLELPAGSLGVDGSWQLEVGENANRLTKMRQRGTTLGEFVKNKVYRGILTGLNEVKIGEDGQIYGKTVPTGKRIVRKEGVFIIDSAKRQQLIEEDPNSAEIIKPLAVGKDIRKWTIEQNDRWLIFTRRGIDIEKYPAIKRHLLQYKDRLEPRPQNWNSDADGEWKGRKPGRYKWYEIQDEIAYHTIFEHPKIVYQEIATYSGFALVREPCYFNNKAFLISSDDYFLLGLLNSRYAWEFWCSISTVMTGGALAMQTPTVFQLPIPEASQEDKQYLTDLVRQVLERKRSDAKADVADLETEIDRRVEHLYLGSDTEQEYDKAMARERELLQQLLARPAEDTILEFKETLWWDVKLERYENDRPLDVAKAICAMLNRDGGTILIGVADEGNRPVGIARDLEKLKTPDAFQRKLQETFGSRLKPHPAELVRIRFIELDGVTICRVDIQPDSTVMYSLNDKVYVRQDGMSKELSGVDLAHWWARRSRTSTSNAF